MPTDKRPPRSPRLNTALVAAGAAAAALALPAVADASTTGTYWNASACCKTRHNDSKTWLNNNWTESWLKNWRGSRRNAGIWTCVDVYNHDNGQWAPQNCGSAYSDGYISMSHGIHFQATCWTGSNNLSGYTSHFMICQDNHS